MARSLTRNTPPSMSAQLNWLLFCSFSIVGLVGLYLLQNPGHLAIWDVFGLISLGAIGLWRWSWFLFRILRAWFYLHWVFPRWRRQADQVPVDHLPHMCFLVPTYKEQPWITERVFRAIAQEAKTLAQPITLLVNSSGDEENAAIRAILEAEDPGLRSIHLIQMTQKEGKRKAMADSLRVLARLDLPPDTVIALMDGDSELTPGTLRQCLPFFRLFPKMGALTTDELPIVQGSYIFSEWFHLRFAQRHSQMCSDSLSGKVMCLTGRFSLFRAETALAPSFADQLEHDALDDWLWGEFKFLSGDDKSTWYWLLRRKYDMLYVPDAIVYSIETISGSVVDRAYNNMRRWYGNMLRNSSRAIRLGPKITGWFVWYSLIDQRISFWTCLITPGFLLASLLQGHWVAAGVVLSWILFSRPLMLALIFWGRSSILKPIHFPLLLLSQWGSSLVKIWTQMNLAQQNWANRGGQSISAAGTGVRRVAKLGTSRFLLCTQLFSFVVFLCWLSGSLNPTWDLQGWQLSHQALAESQLPQIVDVTAYEIWPNDQQDDAAALQTLIADLPPDTPVEIRLPIGELDLEQPVEINRGDVTLKGQGPGRTVFQVHFDPSVGTAAFRVRPPAEMQPSSDSGLEMASSSSSPALHNIHLNGFTLRQTVPQATTHLTAVVDGIVLENVIGGSVTHLTIEPGDRNPLVLDQTQNVKVEYVATQDKHPGQPNVVIRDRQDTQTGALPSSTTAL